jgi:hypothetical protein
MARPSFVRVESAGALLPEYFENWMVL